MGKAWEIGFQKNPRKPVVQGEPGKLVLMLSPWYECFLALDSHPLVYLIMCEIHGLSHQFPVACGKAAKLIEWEEPGKQVSRKIQESQSYRKNLGNQYSCFPHSMSAFFPLDSHSMVYFIIWEMQGFPHQFPIAQENAAIPNLRVLRLFSTVLFFLLFPKPGDSLNEQKGETIKVNSILLKKEKSVLDKLELKAKHINRRRERGCDLFKKEECKYTLGKNILPYTKIYLF